MHDQSTRHEAAQGRRHGTGQRAQDCQEQRNGDHGTAYRNGWNRADAPDGPDRRDPQPGRLPDGNGQDKGEGRGRCRRHGQRDRLPDSRGQHRHGTGTGQYRRHGRDQAHGRRRGARPGAASAGREA